MNNSATGNTREVELDLPRENSIEASRCQPSRSVSKLRRTGECRPRTANCSLVPTFCGLPTSGLQRMNKLKRWLRHPVESRENLDRCITWAIRGGIVIAFIAIAFAVTVIVLQVKTK
jgi:hypothetical protein